MLIVLAAAFVIAVFIICFAVVQWWIRRRPGSQSDGSQQVRRTLENAAQTLGGSDFLRQYPPIEEVKPPTHDA